MTSSQIRQSFLDFFKSKGHSIVPSSSLMPDSPNLLFTNAGMNQFVPIFLGQRAPDVSKWAGAIPGSDTRAADTQKCIRAGGKHNDLEDVGLDTYHHTFFEMLGNWSFGDYFKKEAIEWAWELVTEVWKFPKNRLYATVYSPHGEFDMPRWQKDLKIAVEFAADRLNGVRTEVASGKGEGAGALQYSDFDAASFWAEHFVKAGLNPYEHIVPGNRKDNFWMMGDTGPCGPCSELHVDLTPQGDTKGRLVNQATAECIEIWNLVFIQFNANPDGTFSPLPAKHVDTGMGFERVTGIMQNTRNFSDFTRIISNYETDIFRPIFDRIEKLSGKKYGSTLPGSGAAVPAVTAGVSHAKTFEGETPSNTGGTPAPLVLRSEQEKIDVAFRVIGDHIRTLSFAIADGIQPGNNDRNYVLRRILRRAVRYGRTLGFHEPFFYKLVDVLANTMGHVFPEVRAKQDHIEQVIQREEEAFNKTLDRGMSVFNEHAQKLLNEVGPPGFEVFGREIPGWVAFMLYDTYGFPLDLTELMARERGLTLDVVDFNKRMEEQKARARAAQKKQVIELSQVETTTPTQFVGYDKLESPAKVLEVVGVKDKTAVLLDTSPLYAEMGGQVGDTGELTAGGQLWHISDTRRVGDVWLHFLGDDITGTAHEVPSATEVALRKYHESRGRTPTMSSAEAPPAGSPVTLTVDRLRREAIQRHHTVTHLLHWALHEVVSQDATQKGSYVGPEKLTFDFSSAPLTAQQVADVERLVNERILENAAVTWTEVGYGDVKARHDIMQFFGDKYGDRVRVVQVGGKAASLDGYSMELCGGTHTRATGEIGLFRIVGESAIAAGIRRIEAVSGLEAYKRASEELQLIKAVAGKVNSPVGELEKKIEALLAQQKDLEKQLKAMHQKQAAEVARGLAAKAQTVGSTPAIVENLGPADGDFLQTVADALRGQFKGVVVLGGTANSAVALVATVGPELTKRFQAGKIIQAIAPVVGGKGGGRPDNARGGGKDVSKLDEALAKAKSLLG